MCRPSHLTYMLALCCLVFLASAATAGTTIVGDRAIPVVISEQPDKYDEKAAEELSAYIGKATGKEPQIRRSKTNGVAIRVGRAALEAGIISAEDLAPLNFDGFLVRITSRGVAIAGRNPHGTLYGACKFLQRYLGIRWYMPGDLGEVAPRVKELALEEEDWRMEPVFVPRSFDGPHRVPGGAEWAMRNGLSFTVPGLPFSQFSHNLYCIFPPSKYGKEHPEYYPESNGERYVPPDDGSQSWQPCTSNPEVIEIAAEAAIGFFDAHPEEHIFSLGMNCFGRFCQCKQCLALDPPRPKFRGHHVVSDRFLLFVNQVARRLSEKHPDKFVGFIAYNATEAAPIKVKKAEPNVYVVITQDTPQHHDPAYEREDHATVEGWQKAAQHAGKYDYYTLSWLLPRYFPHTLARELEWSAERGLQGWFVEAYPMWALSGPLTWIAAQMMWDPSLNVDDLVSEYCMSYFGPAAQPMARYFAALEEAWDAPRQGRWFEGWTSLSDQLAVITPEAIRVCDRHLTAAEQAANTTISTRRVAFVRDGFDLAAAYVHENAAISSAREALAAGATPQELIDATHRISSARASHHALWNRLKDDPMQTYYHQMCFTQEGGIHTDWDDKVASAVREYGKSPRTD